jgi:predicted secreted hydrolase
MRAEIKRRSFVQAVLLLGAGGHSALAQGFSGEGFAGLGRDAGSFAPVVPGRAIVFPADYGAHPAFRIEWWYVTANLVAADGTAYGAQWTLFRQATTVDAEQQGWANRQLWMGHAALTSADTHRFAEKFARGGIGQAGVDADPLHAWIDDWELRGRTAATDGRLPPLALNASGSDFSYRLQLSSDRAMVLQGEAGYSRKSERGQASYYYSQPYFSVSGEIALDTKAIAVTGHAWMDREWSSQPLASDQTGWDWFSLHLDSGEKLMLFRLRQRDNSNYFAGNWIGRDGQSQTLSPDAITMTPVATTSVAGRSLPTQWRLAVPTHNLDIACVPLNAQSWMATRFAYWEGPISFTGSHRGVGYLEMTGYR